MSNDKKSFKHIFKPLGKYVIIRSLGEIKEVNKSIALPDELKKTYAAHRQWIDNDNTIYEIGDEVSKVKVGDKVLLDAHTKLKKIDAITKIVEEKTGVKFDVEIKNDKNVLVNTIEKEKYFAVEESEILCILN